MKSSIKLILLLLLALIVFIFYLISICNNVREEKPKETNVTQKYKSLVIDFSKRLHKAYQKIGQYECEKAKKNSDEVSKSGGWCSTYSGLNSSLHYFDEALGTALSKFLASKTVASFGDGPGAYKKFITQLNQVKCYDAFDGAPYAESTTENQVQFLDLTLPIHHLKQYDWVVSLEVAEHIHPEFESTYLDNLVRHAKEGNFPLVFNF